MEGAMLAAAAAVGVLQLLRPTILGWAMLLTPFVLFAGQLAASGPRIPLQDWGPLALLAGLPALGLVVGHPWSRLTLFGSAPRGR
jgi:hypothetical protein